MDFTVNVPDEMKKVQEKNVKLQEDKTRLMMKVKSLTKDKKHFNVTLAMTVLQGDQQQLLFFISFWWALKK